VAYKNVETLVYEVNKQTNKDYHLNQSFMLSESGFSYVC